MFSRFHSIRILLLLAALLPCPAAFAQSLNPEYPKRDVVNKIKIDALDAFDPKIPAYRNWVFRFLNTLHNKTSNDFIRRELLFKEGDVVDADLLEETERNLRQLRFLDNVKIKQERVGPNLVDLSVMTEDQWTLQFNVSAGKSKGISTFEFSVEENNFLGLGKTVGLGYEQGPDRTTYGLLYSDPQFWNSRWNFDSNFESSSDGWRYRTDFVKPFYSMDTRWAYGVSWDSGSFTHRLHTKGGKTAAEIDTDHRTGIFFAARSWGQRYNKRKFGGVFHADSFLYPNPARIILPEASTDKLILKNLHPIDRENFQYGTMFQWDRQRWIEQSYLDNFGRIEDEPDGILMGAMLTRSTSVDSNPDYYQLYSMLRYSKGVSNRQYFTLQSEFSGRRDVTGSVNNMIFSSSARYYFKLSDFNVGKINFPRQTLAANLETILTSDVDAPFMLSLGEDEGLRGYTFKSFTGQNRVLFNIEDRVFTPLDFRIVAIGLVAFMDAGYVWSSDEHFQFRDFGVSAGFGLRIGLKKSQSAKVVRVDFAIPLKQEKGLTVSNNKGWSISVSSGQIFEAIGEIPRLFQLF